MDELSKTGEEYDMKIKDQSHENLQRWKQERKMQYSQNYNRWTRNRGFNEEKFFEEVGWLKIKLKAIYDYILINLFK